VRGTIPWVLRFLVVREIDCGDSLARGYMPAHQRCELFYPPAGSASKNRSAPVPGQFLWSYVINLVPTTCLLFQWLGWVFATQERKKKRVRGMVDDQEHFFETHIFVRDWNDCHYQSTGEESGSWYLKLSIQKCSFLDLRTLTFGRPKHLKNDTKILTNTSSDFLAILPKKIKKKWKKIKRGLVPFPTPLSRILINSLSILIL